MKNRDTPGMCVTIRVFPYDPERARPFNSHPQKYPAIGGRRKKL